MHEASAVATVLARRAKQLATSRRFRIFVFGLVLIISLSLVFHRFSPKNYHTDCTFRIPAEQEVHVAHSSARRMDRCMKLELAATNSSRTLGLSGRSAMDWDRGMLFDFVQTDEYCMWMKGMNFALDIIWLNEQKEIIYMIENVTPDTYPRSFCGPQEARFVVEVNSGVVKAANLNIGQRMRF